VAYDWKTELPGVFSRHSDNCPVRDGGQCTCGPLGYRASLRDWETNRRTVSPMFDTLPEALAWQQDEVVSVSKNGSRPAVDRTELGALIDEFLQAAEDGMVRDPHGRPYARESIRALRGALSYVDSELGPMAAQDVRRRHVQGLVSQLRDAGLPPERIIDVVNALSALYSYAIRRDLVGYSPVVELELPESEPGAPDAVPSYANADAPPSTANTEAPEPWATADPWTAPPQAGPPWTPPPFDAHADPQTPPSYTAPGNSWPPPDAAYGDPRTGAAFGGPGYTSGGFTTPPAVPTSPTNGYGTGPFSAMFGAPGPAPDANYDATMQERWLWWTVRIIVIVFVLIALVLVAESV
jgi:hypothetical protein